MTNEKKQEVQPDYTACPMWGQGGHYIADPVTGKRTRVSPAIAAETPAAAAPQAVPTGETAPTESTSTVKGKRNE